MSGRQNILKSLALTLMLITFVACSNKNELDVNTAEFATSLEKAYLMESVDFVAKDTMGGNEYSWDFGDGNALIGKYAVTHNYEKGGSYIVSMSVNGFTSSKEITVYNGTLSFKILNKSSKYLDFLTYIDNYETGSVSRFLVDMKSQSDTIYGSNLYQGNHHLFGISMFIENSEYTLPGLIWVDDFQHYDIIIADTTKVLPRSSHGDAVVVLVKDL